MIPFLMYCCHNYVYLIYVLCACIYTLGNEAARRELNFLALFELLMGTGGCVIFFYFFRAVVFATLYMTPSSLLSLNSTKKVSA